MRTTPAWTPPQSSADAITCAAALSARSSARRTASSALPVQCSASLEFDLEGEIELGRRHESSGALEQAHGGGVVLADGRAVAAGREAPPRRGGQVPSSRHPELGAVAAGLLEVVADDLVQLDEFGPCSSSQTAKR